MTQDQQRQTWGYAGDYWRPHHVNNILSPERASRWQRFLAWFRRWM